MRLTNKYFFVLTFTLFLVGCANTKTATSPKELSTAMTTPKSGLTEADDTNTDTASGGYGTIKWQLSKASTLTISGTGKINGDELSYDIKTTSIYEEHNVKELIILDGITHINSSCFSGYSRLQKVEMADSVKVIEKYAFYECTKLKSVILSQNLIQIDKEAFSYCTSLKTLVLPPKLKRYSKNAIKGCWLLEKLENQSPYEWELCTKDMAGKWYYNGKMVQKIPSGGTAILKSDKYQITYDLGGGTPKTKLPDSYLSKRGCKLPTDPVRTGYRFAGWSIQDEKMEAGYEQDSILPGECGNRRATALWLELKWKVTKNGNIHVNWNLEPIGFNQSLTCFLRYSPNADMSDWETWCVYDGTEGIVEDIDPEKLYYVEYAVIDDIDDYESMSELPWRGKHKITLKK